jgi:hypothetical protein
MVLIGIGHGGALAPLTSAGVDAEDVGAASGLVNVAHRLGGCLGLGVLVTVFAADRARATAGTASRTRSRPRSPAAR